MLLNSKIRSHLHSRMTTEFYCRGVGLPALPQIQANIKKQFREKQRVLLGRAISPRFPPIKQLSFSLCCGQTRANLIPLRFMAKLLIGVKVGECSLFYNLAFILIKAGLRPSSPTHTDIYQMNMH